MNKLGKEIKEVHSHFLKKTNWKKQMLVNIYKLFGIKNYEQ